MFQFEKDFARKPEPQANKEWFSNHSWDPSLLMDGRSLREAATLEEEVVHPNTTPRENATHADYIYQRPGDDPFSQIYSDHGGEG